MKARSANHMPPDLNSVFTSYPIFFSPGLWKRMPVTGKWNQSLRHSEHLEHTPVNIRMRTNHDQTRTKQHLSSPIRRSLLHSSFPLSTAVFQRLSSRDASFNQHKVTAAACCGNISVLDIPRGRRKCSRTPCGGCASA